MSYTIGYVIYGLPITDELREAFVDFENYSAQEIAESHGFDVVGGSSGYLSGYCGVVLTEIDESRDVHLTTMPGVREVNHKKKEKALKKISGLEPDIKEMAGGDDAVDVYIVWGQS